MGELTAEDQASAGRIAKRMLVHREAIRLVHNQESALVGLDRLQKLDDLIETVNDDTARGRSIRRVTRSCSDLINELIELLLIHETSPSVGAVSDTAIPTVGDAADGSGSSPAGSSAALSGRDDILSALSRVDLGLIERRNLPADSDRLFVSEIHSPNEGDFPPST